MLLAASAHAQLSGPAADTVRQFAEAMSKLEGLSGNVTIQVVGGARRTVSLQLAQPNLARVDTPERLIVADGERVTIYDKRQRVFFRRSQTAAELARVLSESDLGIFQAFFNARAVDAMFGAARAAPNATRRGVEYRVVTAALAGAPGRSMSLYLRMDDGIVRVAELRTGVGAAAQTTVIDASALALGRPQGEGVFAFKAPDGTREVQEADLVAFRWHTDLEEAKTIARATGRKLMLSFWFEGCSWCARLKSEVFSTTEFQDFARQFVFVSIDMRQQPLLTRTHNVSAAPTTVFLDSNGEEIRRETGFLPLAEFLDLLREVAGG
jgi:thiol-disulfide isomerase/thioredoxin